MSDWIPVDLDHLSDKEIIQLFIKYLRYQNLQLFKRGDDVTVRFYTTNPDGTRSYGV